HPTPLATSTTAFPYTTLFRSTIVTVGPSGRRDIAAEPVRDLCKSPRDRISAEPEGHDAAQPVSSGASTLQVQIRVGIAVPQTARSEEHTLNSSHQIISYAVFC